MANAKLPATEAQSTTSTSTLTSVETELLPSLETEPTSVEPDPLPNTFEKIESWAKVVEELPTSEDDGFVDWQLPNANPRLKFKPEMADFIYPKSCYTGFQPLLPITKECFAVEDLVRELKRLEGERSHANLQSESATSPNGEDDHIEFNLCDFSIYSPDKKQHGLKLNGLQHLHTKAGISVFLFDGILSVGNVRRYVQGVPFEEVPVGNYGGDLHTVGGDIWIRSTLNQQSEIYYRLKNPSKEYQRFHKGFLWLADLAKHFVDFCDFCGPGTVTLMRFREEFSQWVWDQHEESQEFHGWWHEYNRHDFKQVIAVNAGFLFKECCGNDESAGVQYLQTQPIWNEVLHMDLVPKQPITELQTIVTPYVFNVFSPLNFGSHLKSVDFSGISKDKHISQVENLHLTEGAQTEEPALSISKKSRPVRVGDVVSITKDGANSVWKDEASRHRAIEKCWYAYVMAVHKDEDDEPEFDVIWLYHPSETSCAKMKYPWSNEYFMSNHCSCKDGRIPQESVIGIEPVLWHSGPPSTGSQLFIRQTFLDQERFVTLKDSHKVCEHHKGQTSDIAYGSDEYHIGQTVLAPPPSQKKHKLEVYEVVEYVPGGKRVMLRRFLRRQDFDGTGRPNELVYSEKVETHLISKISGKCLVRFYSEEDVAQGNIPAPYCRDGNGNAFYISTRAVDSDGGRTLVPIHDKLPPNLIQGFDPSADLSRPVLRGMDLYCGGGNFGRGIEEGGAVHNEWAVDIYDAAIHSYRANLKDPEKTKMFFGSVNDLLYQAMQGNPNNSDLIPAPGEVDFISAGSPCQGFSILNWSRNNASGLRNQSLVASVAAYVDFYRPKYGLLENVMNMAQSGFRRDEDVLSQLVCAIVGMGYQVELFVLDAWSCGSPQNRTRIFVSFAAPGLVPLKHPDHSHSHPDEKGGRGLGKLANGQSFGHRKDMPTPFSWIPIGEATKHLPLIGDAHTYHCTSHPYHVLAPGIPSTLKQQIDCIPTHPRGMNFAKAWKNGNGVLSKEDRSLFPALETKKGKFRESVRPNSRAWGRVHPDKLIPTIVVATHAVDARMGMCLHWDEPRYITIAEAQIAQGFLDGEVLVGKNKDWWKILGNSVCRNVALALGLSLREAWLSSDDLLPPPVKKSAIEPLSNMDQPHVLLSDSTDELMRGEDSLLGLPATPSVVQRPGEGSKRPPRARIIQTSSQPRPPANKPVASRDSTPGTNGGHKETRIFPPSRPVSISSMSRVPSKAPSPEPHRPQKRKTILPPPREKEPKIPRLNGSSSASSIPLAQNPAIVDGDNDVEVLGVAVRTALNSNEMQLQLAKAQERLIASRNMGNNGINRPQRPRDVVIPPPQREVSISPGSFASPEHHKRFQARTIVTPSTGRTKLPSGVSPPSSPLTASRPKSPRPHVVKKYKTTVEVLVEVIDLVSDSEEEDVKPEILNVGGNSGGVPKYRPVDNSAFGAYGQTRGVMDNERATAFATSRKRKM